MNGAIPKRFAAITRSFIDSYHGRSGAVIELPSYQNTSCTGATAIITKRE